MKNKTIILPDGRSFYYPTIEVVLAGNQQEIIPLKTQFTMDSQVKVKDEIITGITSDMILPTTVSLCPSSVFVNENCPVYTWFGDKIPEGAKFEEPLYVILDKADNYQLISMDIMERFDAKLINCVSVRDAVAKMAASAYISQIPSKNDLMGYSGAQDSVLAKVKRFADKYRIQGTVSQIYFGIDVKKNVLQNIALFGNQNVSESRTEEEATSLYLAVVDAFGVKFAGQTRYAKGVLYAVKAYGLNETIAALKQIGGEEKIQIAVASCEQKVACLQSILIMQISKLQSLKTIEQSEPLSQAV